MLKVILSIEAGSKSQKEQECPAQKKQAVATGVAPVAPMHAPTPAAEEPQMPGKFPKALSILADESGLAVSDLTDGTVFNDVGIDSLLGLTITARFREELNVDLDSTALFFEYPSIGELRTFFGGSEASEAESIPSLNTSHVSSTRSSNSGVTTPATEEEFSDSPKADLHRTLQIISEESGVAKEELTNDTHFADSGVDSLLSLVITSRLRDELELDIQHETFLLECPTVGDLRQKLAGDVNDSNPAQPKMEVETAEPEPVAVPEAVKTPPEEISAPKRTESEEAALAARQKGVDDYVQKYTSGFSGPADPAAAATVTTDAKVVLVTGASGSLGGQIVHQIAQMPDVKKVVCVNREKNVEPYQRQQKAMRDKGIRSFDEIRPKLLVLQTDTAKPNLGLPSDEYEDLVNSVTHLIHNAWPMSAKRALPGFEPQFQVMRNLIDLAAAAASRRPATFKFGFQLVSSIGVVGQYKLGSSGSDDETILVPEDRARIEDVLPNGYGDAKWGCERMLDETLHKHPSRFRAMVARLGQIAGSSDHGYWNPTEHFGFLVKSSQTLGALPDAPRLLRWTPVDFVAGTLIDLVLGQPSDANCNDSTQETPLHNPVYHVENPTAQPWSEVNAILSDALGGLALIPFEEWAERVRAAPAKNNPAATLLDFLDATYLRLACGGLVLDTQQTLQRSPTLRGVGAVSELLVRKYVHIWKEIGFLDRVRTKSLRSWTEI